MTPVTLVHLSDLHFGRDCDLAMIDAVAQLRRRFLVIVPVDDHVGRERDEPFLRLLPARKSHALRDLSAEHVLVEHQYTCEICRGILEYL